EHILFIPVDVIRDLPTAFDWDDVDYVASENEELRTRLNVTISNNWKQVIDSHTKTQLKNLVLEEPELLSDLIRQYREKPGAPYDFARDVLGETIWFAPATQAANENPLDLSGFGQATAEN